MTATTAHRAEMIAGILEAAAKTQYGLCYSRPGGEEYWEVTVTPEGRVSFMEDAADFYQHRAHDEGIPSALENLLSEDLEGLFALAGK